MQIITPVPSGSGSSIPPKSSTSRPLSPVLAKMVPGGVSGTYPQQDGGGVGGGGGSDPLRGQRGGGDHFGPPPPLPSTGSRPDVYAENGGSTQRREMHEVRSVGMTLGGVASSSTMESPYLRDRRDRPY